MADDNGRYARGLLLLLLPRCRQAPSSDGVVDPVAESPQPSSLDALLSSQNQTGGLNRAIVVGSSTSASCQTDGAAGAVPQHSCGRGLGRLVCTLVSECRLLLVLLTHSVTCKCGIGGDGSGLRWVSSADANDYRGVVGRW